jgi:hypothetical protein
MVGFGIDEGTALISSGSTLSVLGTNNVHMISLKDAKTGSTSDWNIDTVRWSLLESGDTVDIATGKVTPAPGSSPYRGDSKSMSLRSTDVFSSPDHTSNGNRAEPYNMVSLAQDLVSSRQSTSVSGESYETSPIYKVMLSIGNSYSAWKGQHSKRISFQDIIVDVAVA